MSTFIDRTGRRYGRLVIVERLPENRWLARCDCGAAKGITSQRLAAGTRSCGCLRRETTAAQRAVDLMGRRFGRLVIVEKLAGRTRGEVNWRAVCDCGTSKVLHTGRLIRTRSCGCLQREVVAARMTGPRACPAVKAINLHLGRIRVRARRKADPVKNLAARLARLHRWALHYVKAPKTSPTFKALGYSPAELCRHIERQFEAGMSWGNMSSWQLDHIVPLATAATVADVVALNQLSNLRPMWARANNSKSGKRQHLL